MGGIPSTVPGCGLTNHVQPARAHSPPGVSPILTEGTRWAGIGVRKFNSAIPGSDGPKAHLLRE
jgi:hypothetical protein